MTDTLTTRGILSVIFSRNNARQLLEKVVIRLEDYALLLFPKEGHTRFVISRIPLIAKLCNQIYSFNRILIRLPAGFQEISVKSLMTFYPNLLKSANGSFEQKQHLERLNQMAACCEVLENYLCSQGTLYKVSVDGIYLDAKYRNPAPRIPPENLIGKSLFDVFPAENQESASLVLRKIREAVAQEQQVDIDYPMWERSYHTCIIPITGRNMAYLLVKRTDQTH